MTPDVLAELERLKRENDRLKIEALESELKLLKLKAGLQEETTEVETEVEIERHRTLDERFSEHAQHKQSYFTTHQSDDHLHVLLQILDEMNGKIQVNSLKEWYDASPGSREEVARYSGMKGYCRHYSDFIQFCDETRPHCILLRKTKWDSIGSSRNVQCTAPAAAVHAGAEIHRPSVHVGAESRRQVLAADGIAQSSTHLRRNAEPSPRAAATR